MRAHENNGSIRIMIKQHGAPFTNMAWGQGIYK